jgi:hypothetical protein
VATTAEVRQVLRALRRHPHKHGWHSFYEILETLFDTEDAAGDGPLHRITRRCYKDRENLSTSHYVTLLCISLKGVLGDWHESPVFDDDASIERRAALLSAAVTTHENIVLDRVLTRQNSFSSARRFIVPQVVVSHFARRNGMHVRLADLGTGAGLLPRQLGSRSSYERFAADLTWHDWDPQFVEIPYDVRWGVDRAPMADLAWVRECYGPSGYYDQRYAELDWAFGQPDVKKVPLSLAELDLLEPDKLAQFIQENRFNVVTCSFALYQYVTSARNDVVAAVVSSLSEPGLFLSFEPAGDLLTPGGSIRIYLPGNPVPIDFGRVSDGHCIGSVEPGNDFDDFRQKFL